VQFQLLIINNMKKLEYANNKSSVFQSLVRIRKDQIKWLKENKKDGGCKTMAGFLDKIINQHKSQL